MNSEIVRQTSHRPWDTAEAMNAAILNLTYKGGKVALDDQIIHVGDLIQSGKDRGIEIARDHQLKWGAIVRKCACQLICIEGNHDASNEVPFICRSLKTRVGNYNVSVGHYPTWYEEAKGTFTSGRLKSGGYYPTVHICGHVHNSWQVSYDATHYVLNINVGLDANNYRMLSDAELVNLINEAYAWFKYVGTSAKSFKTYSFKQWKSDMAKKKQAEAEGKNAKMMEWLKANKPEVYAAKMKKESKKARDVVI